MLESLSYSHDIVLELEIKLVQLLNFVFITVKQAALKDVGNRYRSGVGCVLNEHEGSFKQNFAL